MSNYGCEYPRSKPKEKVDMPTTLRELLEKFLYDVMSDEGTDKELIDTALTAIQKWAEEKVPAKKSHITHFTNQGVCSACARNKTIDETLANIRGEK